MAIFLFSVIVEGVIYIHTKNNQYLIQEDWDKLKNKNFDLLFIGNSRVWLQVDAEMVSEKLNCKAYDLAQDGRMIDLLWIKFKLYIKYNKKPTDIYLLYDPYFFDSETNNTFYGKENYLSTMYMDRLGINHVFKNDTGYHQYETYIPLIRYSGYGGLLFDHILNIHKADKHSINTYQYGSDPLNWEWNKYKFWNQKWQHPLITNNPFSNFCYVDSFKQYCKVNNVKLHLFYPPQSWTSYNTVSTNNIQRLTQFAKEKDIDFYNFNSEYYNDSTLFVNHTHLNKKGSILFTNQLLKHYFNK